MAEPIRPVGSPYLPFRIRRAGSTGTEGTQEPPQTAPQPAEKPKVTWGPILLTARSRPACGDGSPFPALDGNARGGDPLSQMARGIIGRQIGKAIDLNAPLSSRQLQEGAFGGVDAPYAVPGVTDRERKP